MAWLPAACDTGPRAVSGDAVRPFAHPASVLVLPAHADFEPINLRAPATPERRGALRAQADDAAASLTDAIARGLPGAGIPAVAWDAAWTASAGPGLALAIPGLASAHADPAQFGGLLAGLHARTGAEAVAVASLTARIGEGAFALPGVTPYVREDTSTTDLVVVIRSLPDGAELWRNRVFARQAPTVAVRERSLRLLLDPLQRSNP